MIDKIKKNPEEIKTKILNQLKNGPKTTTEISESINSNWLTTEKFIKELKDDNLILEVVSSPKMKVYRRTDDLAFYGLPFSEEIRNKSFSLLCTIAQNWRDESKNKTNPPKTILQKIAVELIENSEGEIKGIPILKFHYGQTLALRYDEKFEKDCKKFELSLKQQALLLNLIKRYEKMTSYKSQIKQYEKPGMEFYKEKEACMMGGFSDKDYKNVDCKKIENNLLRLSIYYPIQLEDTFEIFDRFIHCTVTLLNLSNEAEKKEYLNKIKEIFSLLWDTITTNYFFHDAERHIASEKMELFKQIKSNILNSKISNLEPLIEDLESEVNSIDPEKIDKTDSEKSQELVHELLED